MSDVLEYPKIPALEKVVPFFEEYQGSIRVEEKIDGSNVGIRFSEEGLILQSRNTIIDQNNPGMFQRFVDWAQQVYVLGLFSSYSFTDMIYGEMVGNGKIPYNKDTSPFLAFDVRRDLPEDTYNQGKPIYISSPYLPNSWLKNIPRVPVLYEGPWVSVDHVKSLLGTSFYSDSLMEGVVVKATDATCWYTRADGEVIKYTEPLLCGKYVREDYKETRAPKKEKLKVEPLKEIAASMVTAARIEKARQKFDGIVKPHQVIPHVIHDVYAENEEDIKSLLLEAYKRDLNNAIAQVVLAHS